MNIYTSIQLNREPFSTSPDPDFFFKSSEHYSALTQLEINIRLKRGLSVVLGDVGTGKTTLLRTLIRNFDNDDDQYIFHMILNPSFTTEMDFLMYLARLFGITTFNNNVVDYREMLERHLFQKFVKEGKTIVLMIDEGQKLTNEQLELLRTLLNYETNECKMMQVVIMAQMELLPRIQRINNLLDRISMKYVLHPLNEYETGELIDFRLKQVGYRDPRRLFSREAVRNIYIYTHGYPRKIAMICHEALKIVLEEGFESVTAAVIDKVIIQHKIFNAF